MLSLLKLVLGILFLILGFPIGNLLARYTKEELKKGRLWFVLLIFIGALGGVAGAVIGNDVLMFSFLFIAVVTSRSLKN